MKRRCVIFSMILVIFCIVFATFVIKKFRDTPVIFEHIEKEDRLNSLQLSTKKVKNTGENIVCKKRLAKMDSTKDIKDIKENEIREAREENSNNSSTGRIYKYIDDPDFDLVIFSGIVNENNKACRGEFYAKKNYELLQEQSKNPGGDGIKEIIEQFENFVDCSLGVDFSEAKRGKIRFFQTEMQLKDKDLSRLRENGVIDDAQYFEESSKQYEECLYQIAGVLTEEEFEALFQFKKKDIQGSFIELLNASIQ